MGNFSTEICHSFVVSLKISLYQKLLCFFFLNSFYSIYKGKKSWINVIFYKMNFNNTRFVFLIHKKEDRILSSKNCENYIINKNNINNNNYCKNEETLLF